MGILGTMLGAKLIGDFLFGDSCDEELIHQKIIEHLEIELSDRLENIQEELERWDSDLAEREEELNLADDPYLPNDLYERLLKNEAELAEIKKLLNKIKKLKSYYEID